MDEKQELVEIYKLHSQLADNVSNRREKVNHFYILVLSGLSALFSALLQRENGVPPDILIVCLGLLGMFLAIAWLITIRSYHQLNSAKFQVLDVLEKKLAYPFFRHEWKLLGGGTDRKRYWELTHVEKFVPWIFLVVSLLSFLIGICRLVHGALHE